MPHSITLVSCFQAVRSLHDVCRCDVANDLQRDLQTRSPVSVVYPEAAADTMTYLHHQLYHKAAADTLRHRF
jgi:hypothetical protein